MFKKIKYLYYDIKYGIENLIRWIPIVWKFREWDACYIYQMIYKHLSYVETCLREYGNGVNSINDANRIKVAKNLALRLWNDDYYNDDLDFKYVDYMKKQDKKMLYDYLNKYSDGWWD